MIKLFLSAIILLHSLPSHSIDSSILYQVNPIQSFSYSPIGNTQFSLSTDSETSTRKLTQTESGLEVSTSQTDDVTFAEFSSSMNCATGDINLSASIPDVKNFKDALKIFAPFAVDSEGNVDFGNFLTELIAEQAFQDGTEAMIDFLAFIHYQISTSLNDPENSAKLLDNFEIFKSDVFNSCLLDKVSGAMSGDLKAGFGVMSQDALSAKYSIDITALLGLYSCEKEKEKNESHEAFLKGMEKSKKIVRAMFNQILNGSLNFTVDLSEECSAYYDTISQDTAKLTKSEITQADALRNCQNSYQSINGNTEYCSVQPDEKRVLVKATGSELKKEQISETESSTKSTDNIGTTKVGEQKYKDVFDFTARTELKKYNGDIDLLELSPLSRASFYNKTYDDFFKSIQESPKFDSMTSSSKQASMDYIKKILTMQQFNDKTWSDLSCLLNQDLCSASVNEFEYELLIHADGYPFECVESSITVFPGSPSVARCGAQRLKHYTGSITGKKSFLLSNKADHDIVEDKDRIQKYIHKKLWFEIEDLVHDFFIALGGYVFPEDYSALDTNNNVSGDDFLKKRIALLSFAKLVNDYWSSPIANVNQDTIDKMTASIAASNTQGATPKDAILLTIEDIVAQKNDNLISFTPFLYQPVKELQMAKLLFQLATPAHVIRILKDTQTNIPHTPISRIKHPSDNPPISIFDSTTHPGQDNLGTLIAIQPYESPFDASVIIQNGVEYPIFPFIYNNTKHSSYNLSIEELDNIAIITDKFKDFFIKRLLDNLTKDANALLRTTIFNNRGIASNNGEETIKYDLKVFEYKQKQRREMLKLLLY